MEEESKNKQIHVTVLLGTASFARCVCTGCANYPQIACESALCTYNIYTDGTKKMVEKDMKHDEHIMNPGLPHLHVQDCPLYSTLVNSKTCENWSR